MSMDTAQGERAELDMTWRSELRRRACDIESGTVELLDVDDSHAQLRAELAARCTCGWWSAKIRAQSPT